MAALKRSALGRGLDALITMDDLKTGGSSSISEIELSKIQPNPEQPRSIFEEETLEELATSIRSLGVIQPITLKEIGPEQYMIISGERRYRASLKAGLERIPAYIKTAADENVVEMALIENIQREDLNSIEIALAYQKLIDNYGLKASFIFTSGTPTESAAIKTACTVESGATTSTESETIAGTAFSVLSSCALPIPA